MNININRITGCYILPSLKDFDPEIFKSRRMCFLTSNRPSTQPSNTGINCPYRLLTLSCLNAQCVYMSLSNAKSGGPLIQLTSLMQPMIVPCIHYVCKSSLMLHIISTCVHTHSPKCGIHMIAQPLYIHFTKYSHLYAICSMR